MRVAPWHGACFTCGVEKGLPDAVQYSLDEDGTILAKVTLSQRCTGAPGHAHGGSLTAIMDEAMGWAVWNAGYHALAAKLEVTFHIPTPLHVPLTSRARIEGKGNRSIRTSAELILPDGRVSARASGVFVDLGDRWDEQFGQPWGTYSAPGA